MSHPIGQIVDNSGHGVMVREIWFCIENMHKLNRKPAQRDYHNNDDKHSNHPFLSDCFFPLLRFSEQVASNASELTTVQGRFCHKGLKSQSEEKDN